jgi:hypothetical protein
MRRHHEYWYNRMVHTVQCATKERGSYILYLKRRFLHSVPQERGLYIHSAPQERSFCILCLREGAHIFCTSGEKLITFFISVLQEEGLQTVLEE